MTFRACASALKNHLSVFCDLGKGLLLVAVGLILACSMLQAQTTKPATTETAAKNSCELTGLDFDGASDVQGIKDYKEAVVDMLERLDFDKLDCIADAARSSKARFPGGLWKLHSIYWALDQPKGHVTDEDWNARLLLLKQWTVTKPNSVTARVALAGAYSSYAWYARGNGTADSVTESGWKLLSERMSKAEAILDEKSELTAKCPESFWIRQGIAQGQGIEQETEILKRAIASYPDYYYYYRTHAYLMLPKWYGQDGDASQFAAESADRVGGSDGDILYFQIAGGVVCPCGDQTEFNRMSWSRIQRGFAAVEQKYGASMINLNLFALMATNVDDAVVADAAFKRLGDNWDKDTWITEDYFNGSKTWEAQRLAHWKVTQARAPEFVRQAAANLQNPQGPEYQKQVEQAFEPFMRQCEKDSGKDEEKVELMLKMGPDGAVHDLYLPTPTTTPMTRCLLDHIFETQRKKETPFPPPPHPDYWLTLELDPAAPIAAK
jgi:hypothetical protein